MISLYSAFLIACIGILAFALTRSYSTNKRLPPGPRGLPILGNLLQVPVLRPYPQFRQWAKQYGSIFSLRLGPQNVIVLNTAQASNELLNERSKISAVYNAHQEERTGLEQ